MCGTNPSSLYTNSTSSSANHTEETLLLLAGTPPTGVPPPLPPPPMVGELVPVLVGTGQYNGTTGSNMKIGFSGNVQQVSSTLPEVVEGIVLQQQHGVYTLQEEPEDHDLENDSDL